ncbi:MAG: hypothetical protein KBB83_01405 [Alphaproteobacteria bacterium]|nr:hypothetical protein [Alphaproteobacteria bacterium]
MKLNRNFAYGILSACVIIPAHCSDINDEINPQGSTATQFISGNSSRVSGLVSYTLKDGSVIGTFPKLLSLVKQKEAAGVCPETILEEFDFSVNRINTTYGK